MADQLIIHKGKVKLQTEEGKQICQDFDGIRNA